MSDRDPLLIILLLASLCLILIAYSSFTAGKHANLWLLYTELRADYDRKMRWIGEQEHRIELLSKELAQAKRYDPWKAWAEDDDG